MEKSESIKELAAALCKFQGGMDAIQKDASNPFFKSKYASLGKIIEDIREPLATSGLSYAQFPTGEGELTTILMHTSGEWLSGTQAMKPVDQKPQSMGSAISYARRYALCAILGLQVDDDDGNAASQKQEKKTWPAPRKQEPEYEGQIEDDHRKQVDASYDEMDIPTNPTEQKKIIMSFVKQLEPDADLRIGKQIAQVVADYTEMNLVPQNFVKIISLLKEEIEHKNVA